MSTSQPPKHATGGQVEALSLRKLPPFSLDAEQAFLGSVLLDRDTHPYYWEAMDILVDGATAFYRQAHQQIFRAMQALIDTGTQVTLITLANALEQAKDLDAVGGPAYLASLVDTVPTPANITYYAEMIQRKYKRRQMLNAGMQIAYTGLDNTGDDLEYLATSEKLILSIQDTPSQAWTPLAALAAPTYEEINTLSQSDSYVTGIPTGFVDLDRMTTGLQPGDVSLIAARPSMGKSALMVCMARKIAMETGPVGIISLEMSKDQLYKRFLAIDAHVPFQKVRTGYGLTPDEWESLYDATERLSGVPVYIDPTQSVTPMQIRAKVRMLVQKAEIGVIFVDYLQLMSVPGRAQNRTQEVSEISRALKLLAGELHIHVVALSQLTREPEKRPTKRPMLADLRDSGSLEQDADNVFFIHRPEVYGIEGTAGLAELIIGKQRNGPIGEVTLTFLKEYTEFTNYSDQAQWDATPQVQGDAWYEKV